MQDESPTTTEARVAQYGCLPPIEGASLVRGQFREGADYYNALIALERCRRQVYRELRAEHVDMDEVTGRVEALSTALGELRRAIKETRQTERRRLITTALSTRAKEVGAELRAARVELKAARAAAKDDPALRLAVAELDERAKIWAKGLRKLTPLFWCSYLIVEAAVEQARKAAVDPSFRRRSGHERVLCDGGYSGEGRIGVQLQGGLSVDDLYGAEDTRARLMPAPAHYRGRATSARGLRSKVRHLLHLRVGSDGRAPVWAVFPLILHRPLPPDALLKGIIVRMRHRGTTREQWTVSFTYTRESVPLPPHPGVVALDLGWRKRPDNSLRVAYWVDDQGRHGEYTMPAKIRARLRHAADLREIQDRHFNRARQWLVRWIKASAHVGGVLPAFLEEIAPHLGQWHAHVRLEQLVVTWSRARFEGDGRIFEALWRWRLKTRHLRQWERDERQRALGHRREVYRCIAAKLAKTYGTVVVEAFDLTAAKRRHKPEEEADAPRAQRAQLHASAPGELRQAIVLAVTRDGGVVPKVSAVGSTSTCHACGATCHWDQAEELHHTCEHCGATWDQDFNGAANLLRTWTREGPSGEQKAAPARKVRKRRKAQVQSPLADDGSAE